MDGSAQLPVTYLTDKILTLDDQRLLQLSSFLIDLTCIPSHNFSEQLEDWCTLYS